MSKHQFTDIRVAIEPDNPSIQRLEFKCIKCGNCKTVCTDYIGVCGTYDLKATGDKPICINCGQCANVCPADSITEKIEAYQVMAEIRDKDKIVIFSTSPSVRIALGEEFGMPDGSFVEGKMVALLRRLGADYVLDTNFAADMTIVEEASELLQRITEGDKPLPHISSAKSPIGMQGPTIKTYFAKKMGIDPRKIVNVAVTPCTAKKFEIRRGEMNAAGRYLGIEDMRDMDYVITTRELAMLAKDEGIDFAALEDSAYDDLMGQASGAGVIFGNTGGVMEAAIRTAYCYATGKDAPQALYDLQPVRGMDGIREAEVDIEGTKVKVAVVYGTANARKLIEKIKAGEAEYHFVEVMACPGGCIGGGQPKDKEYKGDALRAARIEGLYKRDSSMKLRLSHENPEIKALYADFYGKPLSELAEQMLHTVYFDRSADLGGVYIAPGAEKQPAAEEAAPQQETGTHKWRCKVCGYIYEGETLPEDYKCPLCGMGANMFEKIE